MIFLAFKCIYIFIFAFLFNGCNSLDKSSHISKTLEECMKTNGITIVSVNTDKIVGLSNNWSLYFVNNDLRQKAKFSLSDLQFIKLISKSKDLQNNLQWKNALKIYYETINLLKQIINIGQNKNDIDYYKFLIFLEKKSTLSIDNLIKDTMLLGYNNSKTKKYIDQYSDFIKNNILSKQEKRNIDQPVQIPQKKYSLSKNYKIKWQYLNSNDIDKWESVEEYQTKLFEYFYQKKQNFSYQNKKGDWYNVDIKHFYKVCVKTNIAQKLRRIDNFLNIKNSGNTYLYQYLFVINPDGDKKQRQWVNMKLSTTKTLLNHAKGIINNVYINNIKYIFNTKNNFQLNTKTRSTTKIRKIIRYTNCGICYRYVDCLYHLFRCTNLKCKKIICNICTDQMNKNFQTSNSDLCPFCKTPYLK